MQRPEILGENFLIIDRQREIEGVGRLDLLCIDPSGKLAIVELKRDRAPREAVAQALDYASWLDEANEEQIGRYAQEYLKRPLGDAFREHFGTDMPELVCQNHRILIVASRLDPGAERIVGYLSERHRVDINAVFFGYAKLGDKKEILVRSVLVADEVRRERTGRTPKVSVTQLLESAEEKGSGSLLGICRQAAQFVKEEPQNTYGGSFRYWAVSPGGKWRMVFGVNVAGDRWNPPPPPGQLDVWIPVKSLAEVTGVEESEIRQRLQSKFLVLDGGQTDFVLRLRTTEEAEVLLESIKSWVLRSSAKAAGAN